MEIIIKKGSTKNALLCRREDNTTTSENLNQNTPYHDIAHFVIEKEFEIQEGFYGKIRQGMSIQELSHGGTIQQLGKEIWLSEIMTRNLQSVSSRAAKVSDFEELVKWEIESIKGMEETKGFDFDRKTVEKMLSLYNSLCEKWNNLLENEELRLEF